MRTTLKAHAQRLKHFEIGSSETPQYESIHKIID